MSTLILRPLSVQFDKDTDTNWVLGDAHIEGSNYVAGWCARRSDLTIMRNHTDAIVLVPASPSNLAAPIPDDDYGIATVCVFPYNPGRYGWSSGLIFDAENLSSDISDEYIDIFANHDSIEVSQTSPRQLPGSDLDLEKWSTLVLQDKSGRALKDAYIDAARKVGVDDSEGILADLRDETDTYNLSDFGRFHTMSGICSFIALDALALGALRVITRKLSLKAQIIGFVVYVIFVATWCDRAAHSVDRWSQKTFGANFLKPKEDRNNPISKMMGWYKPKQTRRSAVVSR